MSLAVHRAGHDVGRDRVQRLMRQHAIQGAKRRGKPWRTTICDPAALRAPDLVDRDFSAGRPDALWLADFTYLRCREGVAFFSFVIDAFSRRIVGWQFSNHTRTNTPATRSTRSSTITASTRVVDSSRIEAIALAADAVATPGGLQLAA